MRMTDIRGAGLAYGANIDQDLENGFVYYRVSRPLSFLLVRTNAWGCRCTNRRIVTLRSRLPRDSSTNSSLARFVPLPPTLRVKLTMRMVDCN
jgi:hypothetical protein